MTPKTFLIILTFLLIFLTPSILADPEEYYTAGVSRDNTYQQDGTGLWTGRAGVSYTRSTSMNSLTPLVMDIDDDGGNEIITVENDMLYIMNFTSGTGVVAEQTVAHGTMVISGSAYRVTPYIITINSFNHIISTNMSHILDYWYNGTTVVLNQSVATGINRSTTPTISNKYPVVKCAPASQWLSNNITCIIPINNRSGANSYQHTMIYSQNTNTVQHETGTLVAAGGADERLHNTHLFDGDNDGYLEVYLAMRDGANGDLYVYEIEVTGGGGGTRTLLATHNLAATRPFTDIIVNRLDGTTPMISWGFSGDGTNYDAYTINAASGAVVDASYCTVLTCPEGNEMSWNMFRPYDATYATYSDDVCYYLRNHANNDPGVNQDTVHCITRYAGAGTKETVVDNELYNMSAYMVHAADMSGTSGLLLSRFLTTGSTREALPSFPWGDANSANYVACIPVDVQRTGSLDIICINQTLLVYIDDAYTNQGVTIPSISPDTGNSICTGETLTTTVDVEDEEDDAGWCYIAVTYANGTVYSSGNYSNTSFTGGQGSVDLYFTATTSVILNLIHTYTCQDQYQSTPTTRAYSVTYSNYTCGSGECNCKGYGTPIPTVYEDTEEETADEEIDEAFDTAISPLVGTSANMRALVAIIIILGIMVGTAARIKNTIVVLTSGLLATILVTFLGLLNAYILIIIIISMVMFAILGRAIFSNGGGSG